jgi:Pro-kumamolisin, activation domain
MRGRSEIPGSAPVRPQKGPKAPLDPDRMMTVSIILERNSQQAIAAVEAFARQYGLQVTEASAAKRTVKVSGSAQALGRAFGVTLEAFGEYIGYQGPLTIPDNLSGIVMAVLGLDTRPIAHRQ